MVSLRLWFAVAAFTIIAAAGFVGPAEAAPAATVIPAAGPGAADQPATQDLQTLLDTLNNPQERDKLAADLRAMIAARAEQPEPGSGEHLFDALSQWIKDMSDQITGAAQAVVNVPSLFRWLGKQASDPDARANIATVLAKLLIVVGVGLVMHRATRGLLVRPRRATEAKGASGGPLRWAMRLVHVGLDIIPIVIFAAVAFGVLPFTNPDETTRAVAIAIINAVVLVRVILVVAGAILAPDAPNLRLIPVGDETAHYAVLWIRRLVGTAVYGYFAAEAARSLGLYRHAYATILNVLALAVTLMLVILILQNRRVISDSIRGHRPAPGPGVRPSALDNFRSVLADTWHVIAILYLIALFFVWALQIPGGFNFVLTASLFTVAILIGARIAAIFVARAIRRGFSVGDDLKRRFPSLEDRANRYLPILNGVAKTVIYGLAAIGFLQVWGMHSLNWLASGIGSEIVSAMAGIVVVLAVAAAVWEGATIYMESYLGRSESDFGSYEHYARVKTLLPLFRKVLFLVLIAIVSLVILAQLGINIAPLLAGAGIIGLAVGFGAQKLVQDIFNGLFVFLEAAVAVGDVVELGGHAGVVESMSMRSIHLRDGEGAVHTVPFSAVTAVLNRTKGFSYYLFNINIGYAENLDRAIATIKEVGDAMRADKSYSGLILEPLEMIGLDRFAETSVVIQGRIKTLPGKQWLVAREFNRRLKLRFDELGIVMPFPQQQLVVRMAQTAGDASVDMRGAHSGGAEKNT